MKDGSDFLVEEYNSAVKLTYHIDELRNKLTSFFLIFTGISASVLSLYFEDKIKNVNINQDSSLAFILLFISFIGLIIIAILGKLRKVQFEHFNIINNIRIYFLREIKDYEKITILNTQTLPKESIYSGSFMWTLLISITASIIFSISIYFLLTQSWYANSILLASLYGVIYFSLLNFIYLRFSKYCYKNYADFLELHDSTTEI
jgi:hypothetical protein